MTKPSARIPGDTPTPEVLQTAAAKILAARDGYTDGLEPLTEEHRKWYMNSAAAMLEAVAPLLMGYRWKVVADPDTALRSAQIAHNMGVVDVARALGFDFEGML